METLPAPLAPLAAWPQFILFTLVPKEGKPGEYDKVPMSAKHGYGASTTDPTDWTDFVSAAAYLKARPGRYHGIGFVFTERDPFFFIDIDHAHDAAAGWSGLSQELLARLPDAAMEVSSSGTGLHIIGSCTKPLQHRKKHVPLGIELYTTQRFVALTGTHARGSVLSPCDLRLIPIVDQYFNPADVGLGRPVEWTDTPVPEWRGPSDDEELLRRMLAKDERSAAAAFGDTGRATQVTFTALWQGNAEELGSAWPSAKGQAYDASSADQALANHLAFWTGRNAERMRRLMERSALVRPKWEDRPEYLEGTILKACAFVRQVYAAPDAPAEQVAPAVTQAEVQRVGLVPRIAGVSGIMTITEQAEHFAGCVYVTSLNKVLTPRGERLDQARFDVVYGGYEFVNSTDGKDSTDSAWAAFTKSQAYQPPIVDGLCFRPELGAGGIVEDAGKRLANLYVPVETAMIEGDPSPWLDHLAIMLPVPRDRAVLLNWMASVKQNPGMKAQWWPVIQGGEGNGKTYILNIMRHAVGAHYAHLPNTDKMVRNGMNFNGWIDGKLFLGLEEIYAANRREFFEGFKTTVTNRFIPIEAKGVEELTGDNRANGIITTNHKDGVPITGNNRRYAPLFCHQQSKADSVRDGMTDAYFARLLAWFSGKGEWLHLGPDYGYRVVNHFLAHMVLAADLDPNQEAIWAPATSSIEEAIGASRGRAEQEILEAISEGRSGFCGDWISSIQLNALLERIRAPVALNKRREMLAGLGYDYHPALSDGRVHNVLQPDNGKPRLYCRMGSISALNLKDANSVAKAYTQAQGGTPASASAVGAFK